eukprot:7794355-Heterocapsa_arctica.AAC.1
MVLSLVATCQATSLPPACREDLANIERHANTTENRAAEHQALHWYDTEGPEYQRWRALRPGCIYHPGPTGASAQHRPPSCSNVWDL